MSTAEHTNAQHWRDLADFARWEIAAGGPDPHMVMVGEASRGESLAERIYRGGCYMAVYNSPYAEILWTRAPREPEQVGAWLQANFLRIETRRERRTVRRPEWMLEYLVGYDKFVRQYFSPEAGWLLLDYKQAWEAVTGVPRVGRYAAIKLIEYLRRYCDLAVTTPDIRAHGGYSPRSTLALLWSDQVIDCKLDTPEVLARVDVLAADTRKRLAEEHGVTLDFFQLQVMLCDYKQSWKGGKQHPGKSVDSELEYLREAEAAWGHSSCLWEVRRRCFPERHLGELQGWTGPRRDVMGCLKRYSYTWSDLLYDYKRSAADLSRPVSWP